MSFGVISCFYARQHICYSAYMPWQFRPALTMASVECESITGSGAEPPVESRSRSPWSWKLSEDRIIGHPKEGANWRHSHWPHACALNKRNCNFGGERPYEGGERDHLGCSRSYKYNATVNVGHPIENNGDFVHSCVRATHSCQITLGGLVNAVVLVTCKLYCHTVILLV